MNNAKRRRFPSVFHVVVCFWCVLCVFCVLCFCCVCVCEWVGVSFVCVFVIVFGGFIACFLCGFFVCMFFLLFIRER